MLQFVSAIEMLQKVAYNKQKRSVKQQMNNLSAERKSRNLNQQEVADYLGVSRQCYSHYENGKRDIDTELLIKLANWYGVTTDHLLGRRAVCSRIPVYGSIAAGIPIEAIVDYDPDTADDWEEISPEMSRNGTHIALRIKGASMEPRMKTGDVIIVRVQPDVESGEIAAVRVNGDEVTCKKVNKSPDGIMLIPLNPDYDTRFYTNDQIKSLPVSIIGKVVELRAKF